MPCYAAPLCASVGSVCLGIALPCALLAVRPCQLCVPRHCTVLRCSVPLCAFVGCGVPRFAVCCTASTQIDSRGYTRMATHLHGGQVPVTSKALGCRHSPAGGAGTKHPGPTNENCTQISFVCLCRLCVPWRCAVLRCSGVCSGVCCAALSVVLLCRLWRAALCCVLRCINTEWRPWLHGHGHTLLRGPSPGNLQSPWMPPPPPPSTHYPRPPASVWGHSKTAAGEEWVASTKRLGVGGIRGLMQEFAYLHRTGAF